MRFVVPDERVEIHDFQWLRVDTPSPNFTVEYQQHRIGRPKPAKEKQSVTEQSTHETHNENKHEVIEGDDDSDDDDDDEL